jgi:predicted nuclease of predicted toxin-antitoxin system
MKILVDMNLSPLWVQFLSDCGYLAVHWSDVGAVCSADSEILDYAAAHDFVVFTHDLDFGALLAAQKARGPSVIQLRAQDVLPAAAGDAVLRAIEAALAQLEKGAFVTVDLFRQRIRLLPM